MLFSKSDGHLAEPARYASDPPEIRLPELETLLIQSSSVYLEMKNYFSSSAPPFSTFSCVNHCSNQLEPRTARTSSRVPGGTLLPQILTLLLLLLSSSVRAELPVARLHSVFPPGGQRGTTLQVTCEGTDLDNASSIHFSADGISSERQATNPPGVFTITIASNAPSGLFEARVVGRFGISNPRFFTVEDRTNLIARPGNQSAESAMALPIESTVSGTVTASAADFYKFEATGNEPLLIACQGEPFDSKMKPALLLFDAAGRELMRDRISGRLVFTPSETGTYLVKVHDLQFRGGKQFPYRLTITRNTDAGLPPSLARLPAHEPLANELVSEQESNDHVAQKIFVPCEIRGQFFPEGDVDRYEFEAKKGDALWIEVSSDRLGQPTDPFVLVRKIAPGEKPKDVQEFYSQDANVGGSVFNTATRDPSGRLEIKEDGIYQVQIRDLFNTHADARRSYRLSIRKPTPDFDLIACIAPPPSFDKDKREAQVWSTFIRRNESILVKVLALRRDNFSGEIALSATNLPLGVTISHTISPEGQNGAWLSISADGTAPDWSGRVLFEGKAKVGSQEIEHAGTAMNVVWDVPDYNNESARSRLVQEWMVATTSDPVPLSIEPKQTTLQLAQAGTVAIPIHIGRGAEFKQPVKMRAYVDMQNDPLKEWQVDGGASDTTFDLDAKAAKLSPGPHQLFFLGQTSGKIRRVRADEVAALEAEAKKDEARKKEIEPELQLRDVNATFSSPVINLQVNPVATASK